MKTDTLIFLMVLLACIFTGCKQNHIVGDNDWPKYQRDNYGSAVSPVNLEVGKLATSWVYETKQEPAPAWFGPAKWDAYAGALALPSMRNYDPVYHPVIVNDRLYYGSTADDGVHCLDVKTGREIWTFTTDAPVRIAPLYYQGNLYFGSDDGFAYSINALSGTLNWKFSPTEGESLILHNDRLISPYPIRSGIIIEDRTAYFAASLLPWNTSYVCAINAENGRPEGKGRYVKAYNELSLEGALVSSGQKLIMPQGRVAPLIFDRKTGEKAGSLPGGGGCFVLITPENDVVHTPATRKKNIAVSSFNDAEEASLMTYEHGKAMVISGDTAFIMADHSISAYDRKNQQTVWVNRKYSALSIIRGGNTLYVGGVDTVYAISTGSGVTQWKKNVEGMVYGMALGDSAFFASTNEGKIYCFRSDSNLPAFLPETEVVDTGQVKQLNKPRLQAAQVAILKGESNNQSLKNGPYANFIGKNEARVRWFTNSPSPSLLVYGIDTLDHTVSDMALKTEHELIIKGLRKNYSYNYKIKTKIAGEWSETKSFELDNFFNHHTFQWADIDDPFEHAENNKLIISQAKEIVSLANISRGSCIVLGFDEGQLAYEVARQSQLNVIAIEPAGKVKSLREKLQKAGVYGKRISVRSLQDLTKFPADIANLMVITTSAEEQKEAINRILAPRGKVLIKTGNNQNSAELFNFASYSPNRSNDTNWKIYTKPKIEGSGIWSHQYGKPDNSAFGGEQLWGVTSTEDFKVQWIGRPGPRFQSDRSGRKTSPLAINGKLFVQGLERIAAIDAYNGHLLWTNSLPGFMRFNVPRDCSNWSADEDFLYVAVGGFCEKIEASSGEVVGHIPVVPGARSDAAFDWGYIANTDKFLIGSAVRKNTIYTYFASNAGWYDAQEGELTHKVSSDNIYVLDKQTNGLVWNYERGLIINPTITVSDGKIYFVECRNKSARLSQQRRLDLAKLNKDLYLVALDMASGRQEWEKKIAVEPGVSIFFLAYGKGKLVMTSSHAGNYYIYGYDATNGSRIWDQTISWFSGDHGGHMSKPAIVNGKVLVKPALLDLSTGERLPNDMPKGGHGCGSYACTAQSVFYRGGSVTMWNTESNNLSKWERLRPDCWISTIPADGLILSPEGGGGCSCGSWLETSIAFAPRSRAPIMFDSKGINEYEDSLRVEIKTQNVGNAIIRYTLDGTQPRANDPVYEGPVTLYHETTITAGLFTADNNSLGKMRSKHFKRRYPAPIIRPGNKILNGSAQVFLDLKGATGSLRYTTDGSAPTIKSQKYKGPITISDSTTISAATFWQDHNGRWVKSKPAIASLGVPKLQEAVSDQPVLPGLTYNYYLGSFNNVTDFADLPILKTAVVSTFSTKERLRDENYGFSFSGLIKIEQDGIYEFSTVSDDGSVLIIDHELVVDNDGVHTRNEKAGKIALAAGWHTIEVKYFQRNEGHQLQVFFEGPGLEKQEIPATVLFHAVENGYGEEDPQGE
ncbi:PQQ-binding-like beta-propeller repeat protein [Fulvivirgaceae bacterium BMA12]|uniref:PQQ-binding-like beta-propeller repeat protein n=1 Tax=Agaribacillus aureus TaxID=3051825 RepID=A0ABT8L7C1_9BACT|nr:PQQ-binding-like beta-propeller repeat protein [Fulvivirgaceae bacterium BMA12]